MSQIKTQDPSLPACSRCSYTGIVPLEKNGVEFGFACKCQKGKQFTNLKDYSWGLEHGYTLTDNSKLMFQQYDDIVNTIKTDGDETFVRQQLAYKDPVLIG